MNFKKKVNGSWVDTPHYLHNTSTDTITTLPADIHPTGTTATVGLKGNTLQSSIPSPTFPVMPQGTGERTAQLIPEIVQGGVSTTDGSFSQSSNRVRTKYIPVESGKTYAVSSGNLYLATGCYYNNGVFSSKIDEVVAVANSATFTVPENVNQIAIGFRTAIGTANITPSDLQNYMLNEGSTVLPYEPYGQYKIPISSANTTTPVYLGEVETTRRVKKLVLTGGESWAEGSANYYSRLYSKGRPYSNALCTHAKNASSVDNNGTYLYLQKSVFMFETLADFKSYLAAQYAAGTPVCVWYALATEETAVINEPLMRIGNYADTVSGITIPTITGKDTVDVETTLKPSEVELTYTGWHDATVEEWDGSQWQ